MWSTAFTSSRSHFVETARVGIQAEPPSQARSKASEAAVAEALRLALGDNSKFRLILVDRGAEGSVRTVLRPEEIVVDRSARAALEIGASAKNGLTSAAPRAAHGAIRR